MAVLPACTPIYWSKDKGVNTSLACVLGILVYVCEIGYAVALKSRPLQEGSHACNSNRGSAYQSSSSIQ